MKLTHRRLENKLSKDIMLFAESSDELGDDAPNYTYGDHCWVLETQLPAIEDHPEIAQFCAEFYNIELDEAEELVNPDNIVETAKAWDDREFVYEVYEKFYCAGFRTWDGAVLIDRENVTLSYHFTGDDE